MIPELTPDLSQEDRVLAESLSKHSRPPSEVPGYEPERWLGSGAFGAVWVAIDLNTRRRVAIKFFTRRGGLDWSLLTREVEKLRVLSSDRYVVQLLEVGWEASPPYYVMEYVEGGSLDDPLRCGALPVSEAVPLFREIVVALTHAHNKGILHCDLKPANILLDQDRRPRLADFGQARLPDEQTPALGTWFYMAPEQADLKAAPDARWDVYALGAVFYCMLTGQPPYRHDELTQRIGQCKTLEERLALYSRHLQTAPRPTAHRRVPGVDRALADIVDRCLAKDPSKRFANVQAVLAALDARSLNRARRPLLALGAVGPALLLIIMFLFAWRMIDTAVSETRDEIVRDVQTSTRVTADLAAQAVGDRIRQRRNVLEREASRPELVQLLKNAQGQDPGSAAVKALQAYLDEREQIYQYLNIGDNWFITDARGKLLDVSGLVDARQRAQRVMGQYLWDRDFFHGKGTNLIPNRSKARPDDVQPIGSFHQSIVFQSSTKGSPFIVSFSVPVKDESGQVLGILAMAVRLAGFSELSSANERSATGEVPSQWITLVQTRELNPDPKQWSENVPNRGLILEHPELRRVFAMDKKEDVPLVHIDGSALDRLLADKQSLDYRDPFGTLQPGYQGRYVVAVEPVSYRHRTEHGNQTEEVNTGWVVLVQEDYAKAIAPVEALRHRLVVQGLLGLAVLIGVVALLWVFVAIGLNDSPRSRLASLLRRRAGLGSLGSLSGTARSQIRSTSGSGTTATASLSLPGNVQKTARAPGVSDQSV